MSFLTFVSVGDNLHEMLKPVPFVCVCVEGEGGGGGVGGRGNKKLEFRQSDVLPA